MSGKWCEHISCELYHGCSSYFYDSVADHWNLCPVCGKKKPEEPIPLWKMLGSDGRLFVVEDIKNSDEIGEKHLKCQAKAALNWFKERIGHINVDTRTAIDLMQIFDEERRKCE